MVTSADPSLNEPEKNVGTEQGDETSSLSPPKKGLAFWIVFLSINMVLFLSALELTAVSTALPTISHDLNGTDFTWVGSAYTLASTAFLPMSGGLSHIFGRKPVVLSCLALFFLGSALCGAAKNMPMLIAARTIQGSGGGGLQSLASIILADLVSLKERGFYGAFFSLTWSLASTIGPVVAGSLVSQGQWRWIFYLNLPIVGIAAALIVIFLKLPIPSGALKEKLWKLDWRGNIIIIGSTTSCTIAITWGGVLAPWSAVRVLVPLIVGLVGLCVFMLYEFRFAKDPLVPYSLINNRTGLSGYFQTFIIGFVTLGLIYFYPVFFQACQGLSAAASGVLGLSLAVSTLFAICAGISIKKSKRYRPQIWMGWCILIVGLGLLSSLKREDSKGKAVGYLIVTSVGLGLLYAGSIYPILAPIPASSNAHALAFMTFLRTFAGIWGITVGSTVLQNQLDSHLPLEFLQRFPEGVSIAYSAIPIIPSLPSTLKQNVQDSFAQGLRVLWLVLLGIASVGFLTSLPMKGLSLQGNQNQVVFGKRKSNNNEGSDSLGEAGAGSTASEKTDV